MGEELKKDGKPEKLDKLDKLDTGPGSLKKPGEADGPKIATPGPKITTPPAPPGPEKPSEETPEQKEKAEQERTTQKKKEFIETLGKAMGIVKIACEAIGISRSNYYNWYDQDPDFRQEVERIRKEQLGEVEDRLLRAILRDESWAITLYLNRVHPRYRPKQDIYLPAGTGKTLEDLLDDYKKGKEKKDGTETPGQQRPDSSAPVDSKQEGPTSEVRTEPGADVLLGTKDEKKPDSQSPTEGHQ